MDIPVRAGRRLRAREVTVTLQVTVTCLLAALLFSGCGQAAQPGSS